MDCSPVRDDNAVPLPLLLKYLAEEIVIVAQPFATRLVIRAHECPCLRLDSGGTESGEVYLTQGTLRDLHVDMPAPQLLVVQRIVLDRGSDTIGLERCDIWHDELRGEVWVLAHILEVAAVEGSAVDIHTGTEEHTLVAVGCLLAD